MGKLDSQLKTFKLAEGDLECPVLMKQEIDTAPLADIFRISTATTKSRVEKNMMVMLTIEGAKGTTNTSVKRNMTS